MEGSDDVDRLTKALEESSLGTKKRFLLVLDLNGLLLDRVFWNNASDEDKRLSGGEKVGNFLMWLRPHATEFAEFVLNNFVVGVWSSAQQHNVDALTQRVFGHRRKELLFQYDQTKCVMVKPHPDPKEKKPLFKKQLKLIWNEFGDQFGEHNTLLLDDSPLKASDNPPNLLFSPPEWTRFNVDDFSLASGGALREFLEQLARWNGTVADFVVKRGPSLE